MRVRVYVRVSAYDLACRIHCSRHSNKCYTVTAGSCCIQCIPLAMMSRHQGNCLAVNLNAMKYLETRYVADTVCLRPRCHLLNGFTLTTLHRQLGPDDLDL